MLGFALDVNKSNKSRNKKTHRGRPESKKSYLWVKCNDFEILSLSFFFFTALMQEGSVFWLHFEGRRQCVACG